MSEPIAENDQDVMSVLTAHGLPEEQARTFAEYIRVAPPGEKGADELGALSVVTHPGGSVVIRSRRPYNILMNWRKLVTVAIKTAGAAAGVAAGGFGMLAAIGLILSTLPDFFDLPDVELGDDHADVVRYLWIDREDDASVPIAELRHHFSDWSEARSNQVLADLSRLRILLRVGGVISKRDELHGSRE